MATSRLSYIATSICLVQVITEFETSVCLVQVILRLGLSGVQSQRGYDTCALPSLWILITTVGVSGRNLYDLQVLAMRERELGPVHLEVAASLNNLAVLLKTINADEEAECLYARSIRIKELNLGLSHPQARICGMRIS